MSGEVGGLSPRSCSSDRSVRAALKPPRSIRVCLLTGGDDRPYALGMASALVARGIATDFIGSDKLDTPELHRTPLITFLNLRGDQREDAPLRRKFIRILAYYARLAKYAGRSRAPIFHILWNNKFEHFDRTLLMFYYRLFGKRIVLTAHNVNMLEKLSCSPSSRAGLRSRSSVSFVLLRRELRAARLLHLPGTGLHLGQ